MNGLLFATSLTTVAALLRWQLAVSRKEPESTDHLVAATVFGLVTLTIGALMMVFP